MKNMVTFEKKFSPDIFYKQKDDIDIDLYNEFEQKFKKMLNFYKSLSTLNAYRKVQKICIIKTPQTDDTILNLLNKITDTNYERISQKVLLKLKKNNLTNFIKQILKYSEKANNNSLLWNLINYLYKEYILLFDTNIENVKIQISDLIEEYIAKFFQEFDIRLIIDCESKNLTDEEYNEFVNRNMNNSALFAKMKMICDITTDKSTFFKINWSIEKVYNKLLKELQSSVQYGEEYKEKFENINNNILECLYIIITSKLLSSETFNIQAIRDLDSIKTQNHLSNKNKFKLLDITDVLLFDLKKN